MRRALLLALLGPVMWALCPLRVIARMVGRRLVAAMPLSGWKGDNTMTNTLEERPSDDSRDPADLRSEVPWTKALTGMGVVRNIGGFFSAMETHGVTLAEIEREWTLRTARKVRNNE